MQLPLNTVKIPTSLIAGFVVVGLLGTITTGIVFARRATPEAADLEELLTPVKAENVTVRIQASGEVQPVQRVNLSPKTQGRLAELYVEQGDRVRKDEAVARMESREIEAQLQQAEARVDRTLANLEQLRNGSRPEEIDRAEARVQQAQARLAQAKARSRRAEAQLAELRAGNRWEDIAEAEASLSRAMALVEESQSRLELASTDVGRRRKLEARGAIPREDLDRAMDEERRARASLEQVRAGVDEARRRLERLNNGSRPEEIDRADAEVATAAAEVDSAKAEVTEARSQLDELLNGTRAEEIARAQAEVAEAEANRRNYQVQLEDTLVRAPFSGIITQRYADPGSFVTPATSASNASGATSTSIMALAKGVEVLAKVPEADISQIQSGQKVEIVADSYPDEVFEGRVKLIAPEAVRERDVTLFQVRLDIETGLDRLRSGMNVDLTFLGDQLENALVVPAVAIVTDQGQTGVLVPDEENQATFREVTIGPTIGNNIQILEGVKPGEEIFLGLPEGQKLEEILGNSEK